MQSFHLFARTLAIYNADNYSWMNGGQVIRRNVVRAMWCTAFLLSLIVVSVLNAWTTFVLEGDLNERAFHLALMLGQLQQVFIYTSMTTKNREINAVLEQLQRTVDSRKVFFSLFLKIKSQTFS